MILTVAKSPYLCTRPFEWFEIHPEGDVFLCCPAWLKRSVGNLLEQPVAAIWNSTVAREIRKSMFNGSFHNCTRGKCPFYATRTPPVEPAEQLCDPELRRAVTTRASRLDYPPKKLNLCFDPGCNLACPSCRPSFQRSEGTARAQAERVAAIILDQLVPHAAEVTLSGYGDPFGSPVYFNLLRRFNELEHVPSLRLHSNGQLWTRELWERLPNLHAKVSGAEISVDAGSAATYALNRPGGSYRRLLDNLEFLASQPFPLTLSMVVQQNNFREMPRLLMLAQRFNARLYLSRLANWGTFSRDEYRQRAVHLVDHPEHQEFKALLHIISLQETVNPGNLCFSLN